MPTNQPSNAPEAIGDDAQEADTAGFVLADEDTDTIPGGGGLGGAAAGEGIGGTAGAPGGTTPNAPIDTGVAAPAGADAVQEAQRRVVDDVPEPRPSSR